MHSLSALKWTLNLYNVFGISRSKQIFCVGACKAKSVSGHASLNSRNVDSKQKKKNILST